MDQTLSRSERETLKAMYRLTKAGSDTHTGALAEALRVSPGTATAAVKRLAERDLAHHRPYRGVELTAAGRRAAGGGPRPHPTLGGFFSDTPGDPRNEAGRPAAPAWGGAFGRTCGAPRGTGGTGWPPGSGTTPPRGGRTASSWPCTGRRHARTASRFPSPRWGTSPRCRRSTTWSPATWPRWRCRARPTPR